MYRSLLLLIVLTALVRGDCDVTPCTRDVIIVIDGSSSMQSTAYISQEIRAITKLVHGWTFSTSAVRLALIGAYFGNEFLGADYYTDSSTIEKRLNQFRTMSIQYGTFAGNFDTTTRYIDERYVGNSAYYGVRPSIQKRVIIFSSHSDATDIAKTKTRMQTFADAGFAVSIIGIGVTESAYSGLKYQKFFSIPFSELSEVSDSLISSIINDAVCFWDAGLPTTTPHICPTTTTTTPQPTTSQSTTSRASAPTTTTPKPVTVRPTQPPFPVGDYQNCSCNMQNLWIDIVFVVDTSASMGADGLVMVKAEISTLVGQMTLDPRAEQHVRVGVIAYNENARVIFEPSAYDDEDEFNEDLYNPDLFGISNAESANLDLALEVASDMLAGMRDGVKKALVIYASAYNDVGEHDPMSAAEQLKESGITIITVAFIEEGETGYVLRIGEIASPRMNFTNYRDNLIVDELEDALCQVNCYCPNQWHQLVLQNRKYGECFFETKIDANWNAAKYECKSLDSTTGGSGHLVYINSDLKQQFIDQYAISKWGRTEEKANYDIGLYYDTGSSKYVWVNGVTTYDFVNWGPGQPLASSGYCVKAVLKQDGGDDFYWETVDCTKDNGRAICQKSSCDTDSYCPPH